MTADPTRPPSEPPQTVHTLSRNRYERIAFTLEQLEDGPMLDIRVWSVRAGGQWVKTARAIRLRVAQLSEFEEGVRQLHAAVDALPARRT